METGENTRECPFCKEQIKPDAIKCKHCGSMLEPERPAHEGVCPFCKEQIHPDAIKCKHCKSDLTGGAAGAGGRYDCGCSGGGMGGIDERTAMALRLSSGGVPAGGLGGMGGGVWTDPGHDCWGRCVDEYVACMTSPVNRGSPYYCRERLRWCQMLCPPSGPQFV
jgi:hypothetical protein